MTETDMGQDTAASTGTTPTRFFTDRRHRTEAALTYDPPYENELDDVLARHLVAYLVPAATLTYQAAVGTSTSRSTFDFLIDLGTRRIAIDYTDTPENLETSLVEDADALALGSGGVDTVLRVRRRDLDERLYDCLLVTARWEPSLFTPYGHRVFARRASEAACRVLPEPEADVATIYYGGKPSGDPVTIEDVLSGEMFEWPTAEEAGMVVIRRMSGRRPEVWQRQYERASLVYGRAPVRRI